VGSALALNSRHVEAVQDARRALSLAADRVHDPSPELLAVELRDALDAAGRVLGSVTPDEILGRIFSTFCIGK
jgi:tRNA modification GTPase